MTELAPALSPETLIYQNRSAMRQLQEYRKEADRLDSHLRSTQERLRSLEFTHNLASRFWGNLSASQSSDVLSAAQAVVSSDPETGQYLEDLRNHMNEDVSALLSSAELHSLNSELHQLKVQVEELQQDNDRLRKVFVKMSLSTPAIESVIPQEVSAADTADLRAELALLKLVSQRRKADGYDELLTSLENIHADRLASRARAHSLETQLIEIRQTYTHSLALVERAAEAAVGSFSADVAILAKELAAAKAAADRDRQLFEEAESKLKAASDREQVLLIDHRKPEDQVARLNLLLKQKDEIHNRLLTAHIQLQQQFGLKDASEALDRRTYELDQLCEFSANEINALRDEVSAAKARASRAEQEIANLITARTASESQTAIALRTAAEAASITESLKAALSRSESDLALRTKQLDKEKRRATLGGGSDLQSLQLEEYRRKVKCSLCGTRDKEVALSKCMHCFCRTCVDENLLQARNRKCPLCGLKFAGETDIKTVHLVTN